MSAVSEIVATYVEMEYGRPYDDPDLLVWCRLHGWRFIGRDEDLRPTYERNGILAKAFVWESAPQIQMYLMAWMNVLKTGDA